MDQIGLVEEWKELHSIWTAIVERRPYVALDGVNVLTKRFSGGTLFGIDHKGLRYVEQNPRTTSSYAARARAGAKIVWIIRLSGNQYIGRIDDGVVWAQPGMVPARRAQAS